MICAGIAAAAVAAGAAWTLTGKRGPDAPAKPSPAQVVESRFGAGAIEKGDLRGSIGSERVAKRELERATTSRLALSPTPLVGAKVPDAVVTGGTPAPGLLYNGTADRIGAARGNDPDPAAPAPPKPPAAAPENRNAAFNEGQIASIKQRLKLTPEQEQYWPPVESALRALVWLHGHGRKPGAATLDPHGLEQLGSAASALVAHLNPDQKREVRTLALLIGLDRFASQL